MGFSATIEERFRRYFRFLDVNKDGVLSQEDFEKLVTNICSAYKTDAEEVEQLRKDTMDWWDAFAPLAVDGKVSEDSYVKSVREQFDLPDFEQKVRKTFSVVFDVIDRDHDNQVSAKELLKYYGAFNVSNVDAIKSIFEHLDVEKKGLITREVWVTAHVNYDTRDEPNTDHGFLYNFPPK